MLFILGWLLLNQAVLVLLKVSKRKITYIQLFALKYAKKRTIRYAMCKTKDSFKIKVLECKSNKLIFVLNLAKDKRMTISISSITSRDIFKVL